VECLGVVMPVDYRLPFEAIAGISGRDFGTRLQGGLDTLRQEEERQRKLANIKKMQALGGVVGEQFAAGDPDYNLIASEVSQAGMPFEALDIINKRQAALSKGRGAQGMNPQFLQQAAANRMRSRQLVSDIAQTEDPVLKQSLTDEYRQLHQEYVSSVKPQLLAGKEFTGRIKELGIDPLESALEARKLAEIQLSEKQSQLTEQLREGAIKDSDFVSKSVKDYEQLASREGMSLSQVSNLSSNLESMKRLADKGNPSALHSLNIIANKGLDPNSAVLLSEADALDEQTFIRTLQKLFGSVVGIDPRTINADNVYNAARKTLDVRADKARQLAQNKVDFINNELESRGSKRRVSMEDFTPFGKSPKREKKKETAPSVDKKTDSKPKRKMKYNSVTKRVEYVD